jgi:hypothetical protein
METVANLLAVAGLLSGNHVAVAGSLFDQLLAARSENAEHKTVDGVFVSCRAKKHGNTLFFDTVLGPQFGARQFFTWEVRETPAENRFHVLPTWEMDGSTRRVLTALDLVFKADSVEDLENFLRSEFCKRVFEIKTRAQEAARRRRAGGR